MSHGVPKFHLTIVVPCQENLLPHEINQLILATGDFQNPFCATSQAAVDHFKELKPRKVFETPTCKYSSAIES